MSVKAMAIVWDMEMPRYLKFVLLAYADHADHEGASVYPSIELIAKKTGYSERSIQAITRELEALGKLIPDGTGPHGTRRWRIPLPMLPEYLAGAVAAPLASELAEGVQPTAPRGAETGLGGAVATAPEPSLELSLTGNRERFDPPPLEDRPIQITGKKCPKCGGVIREFMVGTAYEAMCSAHKKAAA